jgi:hypothetical protein
MERLAVPSRSFTFLSAGRAIIAEMSEEADIAQLVVGAGAGWQTWGEEDLIALLRHLRAHPEEARSAGQGARKVFEDRFTRASVTSRYGDVIAGLQRAADDHHQAEALR